MCDKAFRGGGEKKGPWRNSVKVEPPILTGLHFLNRGFLVAPDLHVDASDADAVLIDGLATNGAIAFLLRLCAGWQ